MRSCEDYLQGLEEERQKIQVFQRELPLCLDLVTQAIEKCKQQLLSRTNECNLNEVQYECSEQTSSDVPVLEEFMPIKRASSDSHDGEEQESKKKNNGDNSNVTGGKSGKKSDWLRSVQLWNQTPDLLSPQEDSPRKLGDVEAKRNGSGGAFHPFKKDKTADDRGNATPPPPPPPQGPVDVFLPPASTSSTAGSGGGNTKEGRSERKTRRCWSPELHRRFIQALQQLGGSHVATPKQIRDLMKVDGLTNDEVKSHLQKYRLHTRRPSTANNTQTTPQFLVVGGIWMPPEYAASGEASSVANANGVYAPIAALPPPFREAQGQHKPSNSGERISCHSEGHVQSHSPATSSSTHTTTASPAY